MPGYIRCKLTDKVQPLEDCKSCEHKRDENDISIIWCKAHQKGNENVKN